MIKDQTGGEQLHNSGSMYSPADTVLETTGQWWGEVRLEREANRIYWVLTTMPDTVLNCVQTLSHLICTIILHTGSTRIPGSIIPKLQIKQRLKVLEAAHKYRIGVFVLFFVFLPQCLCLFNQTTLTQASLQRQHPLTHNTQSQFRAGTERHRWPKRLNYSDSEGVTGLLSSVCFTASAMCRVIGAQS